MKAWAEGDGYYHVDQVVPERPEIPDGAQSLFWAYNGIQVCSQDTKRALPLFNCIVRLMGGVTLKKMLSLISQYWEYILDNIRGIWPILWLCRLDYSLPVAH